jgi:hypothetical protein
VIATAEENRATSVGESRTARARSFLGRRDPAAWLVGALSAALGVVFAVVVLAYNGGHLIAPIDDAYIHLQYASQLGAGHPFQYNTGDPISTGESSLLYAFVLAAGYLLGFHGTWLLVFAVAVGIACMAGTSGLVYHLGRTLVGRTAGVWCGVLVAVSGPLLWGAASGMEVGLTALLAAATLLAFVREDPRYRFTPVLAFLLTVVRTEGMILALAVCAAMVWTLIRNARSRGSAAPRVAGRVAWSLLPLLAIAGQYLFFVVATGTARANGVSAKSYLFDQPVFYGGQFLDKSVANLRNSAGLFAGFTNQDFVFPGALLVALVGVAYLLLTRPRWRPLVVAIAVGLAVISVSISTLSTALYHEMRYWQPFLPIFILLTVCGLQAITGMIPGPRARRAGLHTLLAVALLFSVVALPTWAVRLGKQTETIRDTDVSVGRWIGEHLPPDAVVAVKDVGAVKYFGNREVVDTIGLTTNGFAEASNNGIGTLYEKLRHMPPKQRPDYFAVYDKPPGAPMQPLRDAGVLGKPLTVFHVRAPAQLGGFRIVPFTKLGVYPAHWRLAGSGDRAPVAGTVRDYLNVGDLASERRHGYQPQMALVGTQPTSVLRRQRNVVDSGRQITGGERFTVHNVRPGHPVRIVARLMVTSKQQHQVKLTVNGRTVATPNLGPKTDHWTVHTFQVPASAVTSSTLTVSVGPKHPLLAPYPNYQSFGYWIEQ